MTKGPRTNARRAGGRARTGLLFGLGLSAICAGLFFYPAPMLVDRAMNRVTTPGPYTVGEKTRVLYQQLRVADLHADTLLWDRRLEQRGGRGHLDLPRLFDSGVALQVFSAVTKTPRNLNFERNKGNTDNITALSIAQRWPSRTWNDLTERALYQAERLHKLAVASAGSLVLVKSRHDLKSFLATRAPGGRRVAAVLAIEGIHAAGGTIAGITRLHEAGYRIVGLTHFFDNAVGGSAHGVKKGGLTEFGRRALAAMEARGMTIDLAHASAALIDDVLSTAQRPVVVSHTGVKGTCERTRNLSDDQLRAIAANGGLIGIAFFDEAVCGSNVGAITAAIRYTVDLIGVDHVALGSDFDGAVTTPFDVTGLPVLVESLLNNGFSEDEIRAISGGNTLEFLERNLP